LFVSDTNEFDETVSDITDLGLNAGRDLKSFYCCD
jgi:hypothetical protein